MNTLPLVLVALILLALLLALQLYALRKLRRVDAHVWDMRNALPEIRATEFRQVEALLALYADLKPDFGLPATRGWAGSPDFLAAVSAHVMEHRPKRVVECSSGTSTLVLARLLQRQDSGGHVYSLEHEPVYAAKTRALLALHGLQSWATVLDAPLQSEPGETPWYALDALPQQPIDLLVIDGPPTHVAPQARYPAGPRLFGRLSPGGHVFLDDAGRPEERETLRRWAAERPDLEQVSLPAEKGLALLRRRDTAVPVR